MVSRWQRSFQRSGWSTRRWVATLLFCVLMVAALAACGADSTSTTAQGAQSPTPTPTSTSMKTLQARKCGSIQTNPRGLPVDSARAKQSATCFWQAYQKCQPAMLEFDHTSVDALAIHTFNIRTSDQHCSVTDDVQHSVLPAKPVGSKTYTCTAVSSKPDGLHFSACGDAGDVTVPM
ncbi:hypothetical protein [Dictyobacter aurantiacus]|uniref:Ig-like domain-containing protein n=1 Tax=Dictyobacter aurantiacus TaxID=1936993 RepID=A0A401ZJA0_9CHLR|nr:hypothetical protein [Dictyobacter aurantiacus]GCE06937.1 hypothetical protein KDAU_42660 [Dictyobacter aurantiacus]